MKRLESLKKILVYSGLSKEDFLRAQNVVRQINQKNTMVFSLLASLAFALALFLSLFNPPMEANRIIYLLALFLLLCVAGLCKMAKDNDFIINMCVYLFMLILYAVGIYLGAVTGIEEQSSSFMVLLFAVPLLVLERPIYCNLVIAFSDIIYIVMLQMMGQEPVLFGKNIVNGIVYGITSIAVSTVMMRVKYERINIELENRCMSETDQLTGLLNRRAYASSCRMIVLEKNIGVIFCDLNALKYTNDHFGHEAGDGLIMDFTNMLTTSFDRESIFRISGDEFVVLNHKLSENELNEKVALLKDKINGREFPIASAGAAYGAGEDIVRLLALAENRMYEEKKIFHEKYPQFSRKSV